ELHDRLRLDLDLLTGLRVAADARLALRLHQAAKAGDYEYAVLLGFLHCRFCEQIEECCGLLVGQFKLLGQLPDESCLGECCCHVFPPDFCLLTGKLRCMFPGSLLTVTSSPHPRSPAVAGKTLCLCGFERTHRRLP